jgi:hypothetical protein
VPAAISRSLYRHHAFSQLTAQRRITDNAVKSGGGRVPDDGGKSILKIILLIAAASPALAVSLSVSLYGGAALPLGGLASADFGHFNWFIRDNPGSEHDLVDIRGLTLTGSDAAPGPFAGVKASAGLRRWLDVEIGFSRLFDRSRHSAAKSAVDAPATTVTSLLAGAALARDLGPLRAYVDAGAGYYFTEVSLYASGEGRSGFVYSNVYTLERDVDTSSWGWYAGGGAAYPLFARAALELTARYHRVMNGGTYDILIHEAYGYDPYHYTEYVFETPLYKTYDDQFVELALGLSYRLR